MSKWWSLFSAIGLSAITAVTPSLQGLLAAHPLATTIISSAMAVIMHWLPSPNQTQNTNSLSSRKIG